MLNSNLMKKRLRKKNLFFSNKLFYLLFLLFSITIAFSYLSSTVKVTGNVTVRGDKFDITFDSQGGSLGSISDSISIILNGMKGSLPEPTYTGYTFDGWYTEPKGSGKKYILYEEVDKTMTLYANWNAIQYSINFSSSNENFGTLSSLNESIPYGTSYMVEDNILKFSNGVNITPIKNTRTDKYTYEFVNWSSESGIVTGTTNIIANFSRTINKYTISFVAGNGLNNPSNIEVTYDETYTNLPTLSKSGYTFDGWFTNTSYTNKVENDTVVKLSENQVLYAKWTEIPVIVTLDAGKGTVSSNTISVYYNQTYSTLPNPVYKNYEFLGWYNDNEELVQKTNVVNTRTNHTLHAKWNPVRNLVDAMFYDTPSVSATPNLKTSFLKSGNKAGIYQTTNTTNGSTSYYYRGPADNYIVFANNTWRIMRITETGLIRIIKENSTGSVYFANGSTTDSNMYYSNSNAKTTNESWYSSNVASNTKYTSKVSRDIFCQEAKVSFNSSTKPGTIYTSYNANYTCSTSYRLTLDVGLITIDEMIMAGCWYDTTGGNYLDGEGSFSMSPAGRRSGIDGSTYGVNGANVWRLSPSGYFLPFSTNGYGVDGTRGVRPVVNLKYNVKVTGNGTKDDPYIVLYDQ